ncbi:aminoacyl--tRNA ligase-related protein [Haloarchaeobius sp. DFWS5]|uniref:aminoacyl--tRNA ligase-related protein n=1 Tax=Haloarchaeobius sp. DFWS5 TaxID=3446114 RepID=UPI003EBB301A
MRRSSAFLPTSRETYGDGTETVTLLRRAGLVREFGSGLWGYTPAGQRVRRKLTDRVRAAMDEIGGQEVSLPGLQYRERWEQSGRWGNFEDEMFTLRNRDGQDMCLAPSHEEGMVHLVDGRVRSYDDLPLLLYQVATKFRDDHARNGLVRSKEFTMKDAYSFHADEAGLAETYRTVRDAYEQLFTDLGLRFAIVDADNSVMGGSASEEFVAPVDDGSGALVHCTASEDCRFGITDEHADFGQYTAGDNCPHCGRELAESEGTEVGHVFKLGTHYAAAMDLTYDTSDGETRHVVMGSYGLGIDRLLQTLVQQHADCDGIRWPVTDCGTVAPYRTSIVPIGDDEEVIETAARIYEACGSDDVLLYDDGSQSVGERFAESDLLGIPAKIVVGNHFRETGLVELETRDGETREVEVDEVAEAVEQFASVSERRETR